MGKSNLLRGDGFAEILRGRGNVIAGFLPHHPDDVKVERQGERLQYYVLDQGKARGVQQEDMIHIPGLGFNGVRSESVVTHYARNSVGGALAGNQIQKNVTSDTYDISVRMDDGRTIVVNQRDLGGIRENTYVRVVNGKVILR